MLILSEILNVPEEVQFKIDDTKDIYIIKKNKLLLKNNNYWIKSSIKLNDIVEKEIKLLPIPILSKKERKYLKKIIMPIKDKVDKIFKLSLDDCNYEDYEFINITFTDRPSISLPIFVKGKYYEKMLADTPYTLDDLGL